jgi:hypothetical protein
MTRFFILAGSVLLAVLAAAPASTQAVQSVRVSAGAAVATATADGVVRRRST